MAQNIRSSSKRPKVINYFPTKAYGQEGDIVVSKISGRGVFLCVKAGGLWYAQTTMQPLQKVNTAYIKNLSSDKMTIKRLQNAGVNTNKFVVSDNGDIKYRTADDILSDLGLAGINSFDVDYKTAYCSLGQYSDKDTCEANGGTWYYSENDSHDSISSTAENQLLTVSQSIGNVDAESTLLYDGSTLEIKRNTDYDDNWQTSAQDTLLKLSRLNDFDTPVYVGFDVTNDGSLTIDSTADITLDAGGDIELNADAADIVFKDGSTLIYKISSGITQQFRLYSSANSADYFNVATGAEGATTITTVDADTTAAHLTFVIDGDTIIDRNITNTSAGTYKGLSIDYDKTGTSTSDNTLMGLHIDTGNTTATNGTNTMYGIWNRVTLTHAADAGTTNVTGAYIAAAGGTNSTSTVIGTDIISTGADTNIGLRINNTDGGADLKILSSANTNDYFQIVTTTEGATTLSTVDADTTAAHMILAADGAITLDAEGDIEVNADGGEITFKDRVVTIAQFSSATSNSLSIYNAGDVADYCNIKVGSRAETTIATQDSTDNNAGHIILKPEGSLMIQAAVSTVIENTTGIYVKEIASAGSDVAGYGQLWIKNEAPNELWFTNDAGGDIQLTGQSTIHPIISSMVFI